MSKNLAERQYFTFADLERRFKHTFLRASSQTEIYLHTTPHSIHKSIIEPKLVWKVFRALRNCDRYLTNYFIELRAPASTKSPVIVDRRQIKDIEDSDSSNELIAQMLFDKSCQAFSQITISSSTNVRRTRNLKDYTSFCFRTLKNHLDAIALLCYKE